jgi:uncharacterized protein YndB with AHSA1/START domain
MTLNFEVKLKIRRPPAEVFAAVVDPKKLTGYFVKSSSGPLAEGQTVTWAFAEAPTPCQVKVREVVPDKRIVFEWPAEGYDTRVEMSFAALESGDTMVTIGESGWLENERGKELSYGNAGGWMHMLCCCKGYLEYNINLRAGGAF